MKPYQNQNVKYIFRIYNTPDRFDNKYILAVPTGSSTINNLVFVYDFTTKSWSTIEGWNPSAWIIWGNSLYCINSNSEGRVEKCFSGTTGDFASLSPVSTTPNVVVEFEFISKAYDWDNPENYNYLNTLQIDGIMLHFFQKYI